MADPEVSAQAANLMEVFSSHFAIPSNYQRTYEWPVEMTVRLLNDLLSAYEKGSKNYVLGCIILTPCEVPLNAQRPAFANTRGRVRSATDGQQRLTTLSLLFSALRYAATRRTTARTEHDNGTLQLLRSWIAEDLEYCDCKVPRLGVPSLNQADVDYEPFYSNIKAPEPSFVQNNGTYGATYCALVSGLVPTGDAQLPAVAPGVNTHDSSRRSARRCA